MGVPVLILGESGTGKTCSLRNYKDSEIIFCNTAKKALPFKNKFKYSVFPNSSKELVQRLNTPFPPGIKTLVVDDAQYLMAFEEMRRRNEKGFQKFTDIGGDFFDLVQKIQSLPDDIICFILQHVEVIDGITRAKTSGQMLDKKITLEGLFSIVLKTEVSDGKYFFRTQNSGSDTVKSPMGMFESVYIENDLKAVEKSIRDYYA